VTWSVYFTGLAATGRLEWSAALWSGSIFLAVLVAATLGWLATPPTRGENRPGIKESSRSTEN